MTEEKFVHPRQLNRRSGRTTRAIDEMIQHLFNHGVVQLWDHADSFDVHGNRDNLAFKYAAKTFFDRLTHEHNLTVEHGLIYDKKTDTVRLKSI